MQFVVAVLSVMACSAMAQLPLLGKGVGNFGVGFNNGLIAGKGYGYNPYNNYGYGGYSNGKGLGNVGVVGIGYGYNPYNNYGYNGYGKGVAVHGDGLVGHGPFVGHVAGHGPIDG
ncbi:pupal cuticle protein Edg-91-like, partial [Haliotis asinina]|uniref:pupal cuticle protein Edg-91-like n=1 Tax=Haliotis asinina TaxID=109174 RepID=UPI003531DF06